MNIRILMSVFLSVALSSCYYNSRLVYLQNKRFSETQPTLVQNKKQVHRIQPTDVLSVQVKSSTETETYNSIFNVSSRQNGVFSSPSSLYLEGYTVNSSGKISIPILGDILVRDLTVEEAQQVIQTSANKYLNKATVVVKLTNFKITILGEVKSPGYVYVYNDQVTILEALGMVGDLTPVGSRENIKLIRQVPTGSEVILLDLTDPKLLNSNYFYLLPNDVLYVEPFKARAKKTNLELLSVVFAGLTTAILVLNYVSQTQ